MDLDYILYSKLRFARIILFYNSYLPKHQKPCYRNKSRTIKNWKVRHVKELSRQLCVNLSEKFWRAEASGITWRFQWLSWSQNSHTVSRKHPRFSPLVILRHDLKIKVYKWPLPEAFHLVIIITRKPEKIEAERKWEKYSSHWDLHLVFDEPFWC